MAGPSRYTRSMDAPRTPEPRRHSSGSYRSPENFAGLVRSAKSSMAGGYGVSEDAAHAVRATEQSPSARSRGMSVSTFDARSRYGARVSRRGESLRLFWRSVTSPLRVFKVPVRAARKAWKARNFLPPTANGRQIPVELVHPEKLIDERSKRPYRNNVISSAIYSIYDFLPRQLFFQFSKLANVYFLAVSILQMIPSWSTTGNYTTIVPLMIFVTISISREGYDDYCRHKNDKTENTRKTLVAKLDQDTGKVTYQNTEWRHIKVGDIVRVQQNEWIPADLVLLHSSGPNGLAYVETMALDGETNLKTKETPLELQETFTVDNFPSVDDAVCTTEDPNLDLYNFEGSFRLGHEKVPLGLQNIIYRGSILRNTASCFGLVVFTGEETKIRQNATANARAKAPKLQTKVNYIVIMMAIFVVLLSVFSTVASNRIQDSKGDKYWYLNGLHVAVVPNIMGFIIMFNTLIPLSLYVSLEISKLFQLMHMQSDIDLYDPATDTPCRCQTATLNEELGQVSYIFTDKTGTLTENIMLFRKLSVAGYAWLHDLDLMMDDQGGTLGADDSDATRYASRESDGDSTTNDDQSRKKEYLFHRARVARGASLDLLNQVAALPRRSMGAPYSAAPGSAGPSGRWSGRRSGPGFRNSGPASAHPRHSQVSGHSAQAHWTSTAAPNKPQVTPSTLTLLHYILSHPTSIFSQRARFFFLAMALCHSASPEVDLAEVADGSLKIEYLSYQAPSPDELALVAAARDLGYLVIDRQYNTITVRTYPNGFDKEPVDEKYEILDVIEFTSNRKRMSVVAKFPDDRICLFSKGADNVMIERLGSSVLDAAKKKVSEIHQEGDLRRSVEADMVMMHQAQGQEPRSPIHARRSLSINHSNAYDTLDRHFQDAREDLAIQESGRRSMQTRRQRSLDMSHGNKAEGHHSRSRSHYENSRGGEIAGSNHPPMPERPQLSLDTGVATKADDPDDRQVLNERFVLERTLEHIDEFSTEGLRTLLYGHRFVSASEYEVWKEEYAAAKMSISDRQDKIEEVGNKIERDYAITGATAIEDKLQEGVPEAIEKLRRANIRMWMLTGDKGETAINIGYSCRLIKDYSTVIQLKKNDDMTPKIIAALDELDQHTIAHCVIVIDGQALAQLEGDITMLSLFTDLGLRADSVIVCRASPAQKASMVRQVRKKEPKKVMLAIGDGANDIAMIQSADIGIGIAGREGLQAARSSDYSIGQFRFLLKLLLVHGRWNYVRTCKYILATFYKEFFFYMSQVIYQRHTMFTGTSLFESWSISMFNTLFTSLPVICLGVLDQELSATTLIAIPELYAKGQRNDSFNLYKFVGWLVVAMCQCVLVSFEGYGLWGYNFGIVDNTLYPLSVVIYSAIVVVICAKLLYFEMHYVSVINIAAAVISIAGYFCWNLLIGAIFKTHRPKTYYVVNAFRDGFGRHLNFWACVFVMCVIGCMFEFVVTTLRRVVKPTDTDAFEILQADPYIRQRMEVEAETELRAGWEYQKLLPTGWNAIRNFKWPAQPLPKRPQAAVTSRRRRRDIIAEKLNLRRQSTNYDNQILDILEQRERELDTSIA